MSTNQTRLTSFQKEDVLSMLTALQPVLDPEIISRAYDYCLNAHGNQFRKSGEPYLQHPVEVAKILAEQELDTATIAAGLLHDVVEDSPTTHLEITNEFGDEIALLVDGVTKITEIQLTNKEERQAETFRKMILSMAKDIRVILIKFADRIHNLKTLEFLPKEGIERIANETLEVYAPLAHRLGMAKVKSDLEDLSFKHLYPDAYENVANKLLEGSKQREHYLRECVTPIEESLRNEGMTAAVYGRPKHFYSIHRKMVHRSLPFDEIYDLFAVRIILQSVKDCYAALGVVHGLWKPLQVRFKDYIASPKSNMYQSIHTTVVGPDGRMLEIQIRTEEMHQTAESGIAAHWRYKEGGRLSASDEHMAWLNQIGEWQKEMENSKEFLEFLKIELFPAEVFIFTPKGDIMQLPKGATALDFAFAVHTDLGIHTIGCKINGQLMPLDTALKSGSTVEVLRSEEQNPSIDWLKIVRTSKAKGALRRWLDQEGKIKSRDLGNELLKREFQKQALKIPYEEWLRLCASSQMLASVDRLMECVGNGELSILKILHGIPADSLGREKIPMMRRMVDKMRGVPVRAAIGIEGGENLMIRFARCCMPVPGEKIVGFLTKGRGISVHRINCQNAVLLANDTERQVAVDWDTKDKSLFNVRIEIIAENRINLLSELTSVIGRYSSNVVNAHITTKDAIVHDIFIIQVLHHRQLKKILSSLKRIKGVKKVARGRLIEDQLATD